MSRPWVQLRSLSSAAAGGKTGDKRMSNLQRPLLSGDDSGLHDEDSNSEPRVLITRIPQPEDSVGLDVVGSPSSSNTSVNNGGDQPRKKKLVWADGGVSGEGEPSSTSRSPSLLSPTSQDSLLVVDSSHARPQSYILYEGGEGEDKGYIHVRRERGRSSMLAGNSVVSEGDITEDQFNYRPDFIKVDMPNSNPDGSSITTAQELQICKRTVLKPFMIFLKLIGWRSFYMTRQDITPRLWVKVLNVMYPTILFLLLVLSCATQVVTCFYRDQPVQMEPRTSPNGTLIIDCTDDLFSRLIFPDILLLLAYLWGLYIFRVGAPEHLITLVETVFLSSQHLFKGQAKMVHFMRIIMLSGLVWLVFDFCVSIARVFSLELLSPHSFLLFLSIKHRGDITNETRHTVVENALRYSFVIFDFFGFIFFDLLYIAVIVTYTAQCQLVRLYIGSIIDKVLTKLRGYTLEQAMVDINQAYKFLQVVNGKLSVLTSVCLLVFLEAAVSSLNAVFKLKPEWVLGIVVGVCNVVLWSLIALVPIIQAARLTSRCQQLRRLGLSVGHRPFAYRNTPQLLLDSFVQYTNATRYRAKLAGIPIYPSFVIGGLFLFVLIASILFIFVPSLSVAKWF